MSVKIYHNPRCSKSRQTLEIIRAKAIEPEIIEYLKVPPSKKEIESLVKSLGGDARAIMRRGESVYKEENLGDKSLTHDDLINAMANNPILIERPIVVTNKGTRIGRPPEAVIDIL